MAFRRLVKTATLIEIDFETELEFTKRSAASDREFAESWLTPISYDIASWMARKIKEALGKRHHFKVGASGLAAENVDIRQIQGTNLYPIYMVYEGNLTPANRYIRSGTAPGYKTGHANTSAIRQWILAKGKPAFEDRLYDTTDHPKNRLLWTKRGGPRAKGSRLPENQRPHRTPRQRKIFERIIWAIARSIGQKGTSTAHTALFPAGSRNFDYVAWVVSDNDAIDQFHQNQEYRGVMSDWLVRYMQSATGNPQIRRWKAKSAIQRATTIGFG